MTNSLRRRLRDDGRDDAPASGGHARHPLALFSRLARDVLRHTGTRAPALIPVFRSALQAPLLSARADRRRGETITELARTLVVGAPNREAVYDAAWKRGRALVENLIRTGMLERAPRNLEAAR